VFLFTLKAEALLAFLLEYLSMEICVVDSLGK
jgi:hypothetical protein